MKDGGHGEIVERQVAGAGAGAQGRERRRLAARGGAREDILPALRNNFLQVAAGATTMSEETIKRLKDAKQSWENFGNSVIIHTGEAIAAIGKLVDSVAKARAKDALGDLSVWGIVPSAPTPTDVNLPNEQKLIERTKSLADALKDANDALRNLSQAKKDDTCSLDCEHSGPCAENTAVHSAFHVILVVGQ